MIFEPEIEVGRGRSTGVLGRVWLVRSGQSEWRNTRQIIADLIPSSPNKRRASPIRTDLFIFSKIQYFIYLFIFVNNPYNNQLLISHYFTASQQTLSNNVTVN